MSICQDCAPWEYIGWSFGWLGWSAKFPSYFQGNSGTAVRTSVAFVSFDMFAWKRFSTFL